MGGITQLYRLVECVDSLAVSIKYNKLDVESSDRCLVRRHIDIVREGTVCFLGRGAVISWDWVDRRAC
jgi:hypothetical protein